MSGIISGTFFAEPFSERCPIPELYQIYHGGQEMDGQLVPRQKHIWNRVSRHLFFSANRTYTEGEYLTEKIYHRTEGGEVDVTEIPRSLFVADARTVPPATLVCTNSLGLWYDDIRTIEDFLAGFKEYKVKTLPDAYGTLSTAEGQCYSCSWSDTRFRITGSTFLKSQHREVKKPPGDIV